MALPRSVAGASERAAARSDRADLWSCDSWADVSLGAPRSGEAFGCALNIFVRSLLPLGDCGGGVLGLGTESQEEGWREGLCLPAPRSLPRCRAAMFCSGSSDRVAVALGGFWRGADAARAGPGAFGTAPPQSLLRTLTRVFLLSWHGANLDASADAGTEAPGALCRVRDAEGLAKVGAERLLSCSSPSLPAAVRSPGLPRSVYSPLMPECVSASPGLVRGGGWFQGPAGGRARFPLARMWLPRVCCSWNGPEESSLLSAPAGPRQGAPQPFPRTLFQVGERTFSPAREPGASERVASPALASVAGGGGPSPAPPALGLCSASCAGRVWALCRPCRRCCFPTASCARAPASRGQGRGLGWGGALEGPCSSGAGWRQSCVQPASGFSLPPGFPGFDPAPAAAESCFGQSPEVVSGLPTWHSKQPISFVCGAVRPNPGQPVCRVPRQA